jgi:MFS transporter, putative metabolite:H+ symporter
VESVRAQKPFDAYQRRLLLFLSVATFFEGYDFIALTQILPNLRADMGLEERFWPGVLVGTINVGTIAAYLLVRRADRWGRRRVLTITIAGYTVFTFLTGFAWSVWSFMALQLLARVFLIGEWAISNVIAAEEFPAARRGMVLGTIGASAALGSIACAALVPLLLSTPYGWRAVYFVGIVPLLVLAWARRDLRETRRFAAHGPAPYRSLFEILRSPYRTRVLQLAVVWFFAYVAAQNGIAFWKEFAVAERGLSDAQVGTAIALASIVAMPFVFCVGHLLDGVGRRPAAVVLFGAGALGTLLSYTLHGQWPLTFALVFGVFGASAYGPLLNAYNNELFPTEFRGDAYAWANNLIGRLGYVISPFVVGLIAEAIGAFGPVVATTAVFTILAMLLVLAWFPETGKRELEETAALRVPISARCPRADVRACKVERHSVTR